MAETTHKSRRPRRRFDDDFKAQAVRLVLDEGQSIDAVACDLDLTETALRAWVYRARDSDARPDGADDRRAEELTQLRKENRQLRLEREILKTRRPSSPRSRRHVRADSREKGDVSDCADVPRPGVATSGYCAWCRRSESAHAQRDRQLRVLVRASFDASKQRYGSPRIHEDLIEQDIRVSRKRVIRLMQEMG